MKSTKQLYKIEQKTEDTVFRQIKGRGPKTNKKTGLVTYEKKIIDSPDSSNIKRVVYEPSTSILTVFFKSGGIYTYDNVPENIFTGFSTAESAGKYFWKHVRDSYTYHRKR